MTVYSTTELQAAGNKQKVTNHYYLYYWCNDLLCILSLRRIIRFYSAQPTRAHHFIRQHKIYILIDNLTEKNTRVDIPPNQPTFSGMPIEWMLPPHSAELYNAQLRITCPRSFSALPSVHLCGPTNGRISYCISAEQIGSLKCLTLLNISQTECLSKRSVLRGHNLVASHEHMILSLNKPSNMDRIIWESKGVPLRGGKNLNIPMFIHHNQVYY